MKTRKTKMLIGSLIGISVVLAIVFVFNGIYKKNSAGTEEETYFNNTYGFSISIPYSIKHAGYQVFESNRGIIAFDRNDGLRLFEIHVYDQKEWTDRQSIDEVLLKETDKNVFTYFIQNKDALTPKETARIQESFWVQLEE